MTKLSILTLKICKFEILNIENQQYWTLFLGFLLVPKSTFSNSKNFNIHVFIDATNKAFSDKVKCNLFNFAS